MAAVMKVISSGGGKGSSTVTRYIAERDRDPEKEGKEKRPLFSRDRQGMTCRQADKVLSKSESAPQKDDVIHIAVSLRPGDFERLGPNNEHRVEAFMQVTREAMQEVENDLNAKDMAWVAGIHLNTGNPHVHLAINKDMTDAETGQPKRVETIPMDMRGNGRREGRDEPERGHGLTREIDIGQDHGGRHKGEKAPEREDRGKVAHRFDDAIDHVAGPVRRISFRLADKDVLLRRTLVIGQREPSEEERTVGRWVMLESEGRPGDGTTNSERIRLRAQVREIDTRTARNGEPQVRAFIPQDELRDALDRGKISALTSAGQRHNPYDAGDVELQDSRRDPVLRERTILGQEMAARFRSEYFSAKVDACESQRDVRRYKIQDVSTGFGRKSSIADLQQRAAARGQRAAETSGSKRGDERREIRAETYVRDVARHHPNVEEIRQGHADQLNKLTGLRDKELDAHDRLLSLSSRIERSYRARGERLPGPIIPRPMLDELHEQVVEQRDFERVVLLDGLRSQMAREFGGHARDDHGASRLAAHAEIAEQDMRVSEQRAASFEKTAHLRKWEIGDKRLSLSDVDRETKYRESEVEFQERRAEFYERRLSFWSAFHLPSASSLNPVHQVKSVFTHNPFSRVGSIRFGPTLNPIRRAEYRREAEAACEAARAAQERIKELHPVREQIADRIEAKRAELAENVVRDRHMHEALSGMRDAEATDRAATGRQMPGPQYKGWELRRLEANAGLLRDGDALHHYEEEIGPDREDIRVEGRAARAFAREIHARLLSTEAAERLESFNENRDHYPLGYRDADGNLRTGTLSDVKPRSLVERLTRFINESPAERGERESLERAASLTEQDLVSERDRSADYYETARALAEQYRVELRALDPRKDLPKPEFTRKELADIERYGEALSDHAAHQQYEDFVKDVIEHDHVGNHPVGQSYADLTNTKPGLDPEPEKSWQQQVEPEQATAGSPASPEHTLAPGNAVEVTGASIEIEEAEGGLAALL
jgi:hypothetical protein